jgi:hypothetical protein
MKAGRRFFWKKDEGKQYEVEIINAPPWAVPVESIPPEKMPEKAVIIRVLTGIHVGIYAIVDPQHLKPIDQGGK